jgi:alanine racemase
VDNASRPTWAEIDLNALAYNFQVIRQRVGPDVRVLAAVKANAYGHGAIECARRLQDAGVDWFGVALPEEGIELRQSSITKPILCLAGFWAGQQNACLQHELTPVVYRLETIELLNRAAADRGLIADVHVKIDTGMGRLGVRFDEVPDFCEGLKRFRNIRVDGLMTHLASADVEECQSFTNKQLKRFEQAIAVFHERGFRPTHIHAANSAGLFSYAESRGNLVRPGARCTDSSATCFRRIVPLRRYRP